MKTARSILPSLFPILDIKQGRENRDLGIKRSIEKANRDNPGWADKAYEFLQEFLKDRTEPFLGEDVRAAAAMKEDFEFPENAKSWGSIMVRAKKAGLIKSIGYAPVKNPKANATPSTLWVKV
jgi:hypothetical protein